MTLDEIVDDYIANVRRPARADIDEFRKVTSLPDAIRHASRCHWLPSRRRHPHQYRIPKSVLQTAERKLQGARNVLAQAKNFEALHSEIERRLGGLHGIGALTIYDIAHRIGAYLHKRPRLVYLHRGTRTGAHRMGFTGKVLDPRSLPSPFSRLAPEEIEDCLCIYKDHFLPGQALACLRRQKSCIASPARREGRQRGGRTRRKSRLFIFDVPCNNFVD
jgi:hypothetical protein